MTRIKLERVKCEPCRSTGNIYDRNGFFPCPACNGTGLSDNYLISGELVERVVEALQSAAFNEEYDADETISALELLVEEEGSAEG